MGTVVEVRTFACAMFGQIVISYYILAEWPICTIGSRDYCHAPLGVILFRPEAKENAIQKYHRYYKLCYNM